MDAGSIAPIAVPVAHEIMVQSRSFVAMPNTGAYIPSLCPLGQGDQMAVLSTSSDRSVLYCLHLFTNNCGWVLASDVDVVSEDLGKANPFLALALQTNSLLSNAAKLEPSPEPITYAGGVPSAVHGARATTGPIRSAPRNQIHVKPEPRTSPHPPPSPAASISSQTSRSVPGPSPPAVAVLAASKARPASAPTRKRIRDPQWDKRYEEKRKAEGKRGHGANLMKDQQQRCTKPFPQSIDALLQCLIDAQPTGTEAEQHVMTFSDTSLATARQRISTFDQKTWRVWLPDGIWKRFNILKVRCCPQGTTVAEFVEMMLDFVGRTEELKDASPINYNMNMLEKKMSLQLSIRAAITLSNTADIVDDLWSDQKAPKLTPTPPVSSPETATLDSVIATSRGSTDITNNDILAFIQSMEKEVIATMIQPAPNASLAFPDAGFADLPKTTSAFTTNALTNIDDIASLLGISSSTLSTGTQGFASSLGNHSSIGAVPGQFLSVPPLVGSVSPSLVSADSPPSLNSMSPAIDPISSPGSLHGGMGLGQASGMNTPNAFAMTGTSAPPPIDIISHLPSIITPDPSIQHITRFNPSEFPEFQDFQPMPWQPPSIPVPGQIAPSIGVFGSQRYHPYGLRNVTSTPMFFSPRSSVATAPYGEQVKAAAAAAAVDAVYVKQDPDGCITEAFVGQPSEEDVPPGVSIVHWASLYGPDDWANRVLEPPPFAVAPDTLDLRRDGFGRPVSRGRSQSVSSASSTTRSMASGRKAGTIGAIEDEEMDEQQMFEAMGEFRTVPEDANPDGEETPETRERRTFIDRAFSSFKNLFTPGSSDADSQSSDAPKAKMRKASAPAANIRADLPSAKGGSVPQTTLLRLSGAHARKQSSPAVLALPRRYAGATVSSPVSVSGPPPPPIPAPSEEAQAVSRTSDVPAPASSAPAFAAPQAMAVPQAMAAASFSAPPPPRAPAPPGAPITAHKKRAKAASPVPRFGFAAKPAASPLSGGFANEPEQLSIPEPETEEAEDESVPPKIELQAEIESISASLDKLKLVKSESEPAGEKEEAVAKEASEAQSNVTLAVVAVMRLLRPFMNPEVGTWADEGQKGADPAGMRARVAVTVGIVERLYDLGKIDDNVVTACSKQVLASFGTGSLHPATMALMARLVARGVLVVEGDEAFGDDPDSEVPADEEDLLEDETAAPAIVTA
ncbi:hypothetical protein HDU96_007353 [Phlyctochytrium bullatum]|nr:hypothetical protein HDU96_007353 [Phlyctochytrium bullatum]